MTASGARYLILLTIMLVSAVSGLSGCGQSGDLYLPDEPDRQEHPEK